MFLANWTVPGFETRTSDNILIMGYQQLSRSFHKLKKSLQGHFDFFLAPPLCIDSFILTHLCSLSVALLFRVSGRGSKGMGSLLFPLMSH